MASDPCWGSVAHQQPMYFPSLSWAYGITRSRNRSGLPVRAAKPNGMEVTPRLMERPALPQPNSSLTTHVPMGCSAAPPPAGVGARVESALHPSPFGFHLIDPPLPAGG